MITLEELDTMKDVDIRTVDKSTLVEMKDFPLDNSLSQEERVKRYFETVKNPYLFLYDGMAVKLEFTEGGPSLQDLLTSFLIRQKSGL